jgi:hypothetical protein
MMRHEEISRSGFGFGVKRGFEKVRSDAEHGNEWPQKPKTSVFPRMLELLWHVAFRVPEKAPAQLSFQECSGWH